MNGNGVTRTPLQESIIVAIHASISRLGVCELSICDFSCFTGFSRRSVQHALKVLSAQQIVIVEHRYSSDGTQLSNHYHLTNPETFPLKGNVA